MKCEIINPSNGCEISGDNKEALALACMLLGGGKYALQNEAGETICPLMLFGGGEDLRILDLAQRRGVDLEKCIRLKVRYNKTRPKKHGKRY